MKEHQVFNPLKNFGSDIPASIIVFLVAMPLCLGIALASGAPLFSGLIAGMVGGIVVGFFSGSPLGVSGPAAGLAVIVLDAIVELGAFDIFLVSVVLAGFLQILLGFLRAGIIAYYFPSSVIHGMLAGIGILIFMKQLPHAVGYDADPEGDFALADGRLSQHGHVKFTFSGIGLYHPALFNNTPDGAFALGPLLRSAMDNNRISGGKFQGLWCDVGTVARLTALEQCLSGC